LFLRTSYAACGRFLATQTGKRRDVKAAGEEWEEGVKE
jgi:hypothetical protein